jgi:hypothetical protein
VGILVDDAAQDSKVGTAHSFVGFAAMRESPSLRGVFKPTYGPHPRFDRLPRCCLRLARKNDRTFNNEVGFHICCKEIRIISLHNFPSPIGEIVEAQLAVFRKDALSLPNE